MADSPPAGPTDAERELMRLLRRVVRGEPVHWPELYRARRIFAAEQGIELEDDG